MRKLILLLGGLLMPALSWGWMGMGGGPDYSRDAGNMFYCASTGTVITQAGVSLSSPAVSLFNPFGSGKNLVVLDIGINVTASPAAAADFFLAYNITPSSGIGNGATGNMTAALIGKSTSTFTTTSIASCKVQGILPATPTAFRYLGGTTGASAIGAVVLTDYTNGKVVVPPGGLISLQSTSAATVLAHILWREEPQ